MEGNFNHVVFLKRVGGEGGGKRRVVQIDERICKAEKSMIPNWWSSETDRQFTLNKLIV